MGTSIPELATTWIAKLRGHDEMGVGTVLGSNIFNGLFIVSIAAILRPIEVEWNKIAVVLAFGVLTLIPLFPSSSGSLGRGRGLILLALYIAYLFVVLQGPAETHP